MPDPLVAKHCDTCHTVVEVPIPTESCLTCGGPIYLWNRAVGCPHCPTEG